MASSLPRVERAIVPATHVTVDGKSSSVSPSAQPQRSLSLRMDDTRGTFLPAQAGLACVMKAFAPPACPI